MEKQKKVRILHVARDDKFFDNVYNTFESDERLSNQAILIAPKADYIPKRIKQIDKVRIMWRKEEIKRLFLSEEYDVVYFHSLIPQKWFLFNYIPNEKVVIWWSWGFDLYDSLCGVPPFINLDLYKPITMGMISTGIRDIVKKNWDFLRYNVIYKKLREKVIKRIDYFEPVIEKEYSLMKQIPGFRAKEFYHRNSIRQVPDELNRGRRTSNVLLGNSATYSNNHLDVLAAIKQYVPHNAKIIIPLNYGNSEYGEKLIERLSSIDNVETISAFLPIDQFYGKIDECSVAVFGVIRQQAQGSINYAVMQGKKVFLYRDSLMYEEFVEKGFSVSAIEEMNEASFNTPVTEEEWRHNCALFRKELERRETIFEHTVKELQSLRVASMNL